MKNSKYKKLKKKKSWLKPTREQIENSGPVYKIKRKEEDMKIQVKKTDPLKPPFPKIHLSKDKLTYLIFSDGGCNGNGKEENEGAYAFVVVESDTIVYEYSRALKNTTSNRMELQAAIDALSWIKETIPDTAQVLLHSDSQYTIHGICTWRHGWIKKGWKGVKNTEQWQTLSALVEELPHVQYKWVRSHQEDSGFETKFNTRADELCCKLLYGESVISRTQTPIGNTPDNLQGAYINHIDGNPNNNEPANLEVVNAKVNSSIPLKAAKEKRERREKMVVAAKELEQLTKRTTADSLLLEVYELALTDGDPIPTLLKITAYLVKNKLI